MSLQGASSSFSLADVTLQKDVAEIETMISHRGIVSHREVVQAGSDVTSLKEGDRVALEPGIPCWSHKMSRQVAKSMMQIPAA
jgi:hypothetical protein